MLKYFPILLILLAAPAWAGSSSIYLNGDYEQVFTTPSGNVLCGGNPTGKAESKLYANDLYCFVYQSKAMPQRCKAAGKGLEFTLKANGKAVLHCAGFEFEPDNLGEDKTRTLRYGESIRGKGWECRSDSTGLICKNDQGRGFLLNRSQYRLF